MNIIVAILSCFYLALGALGLVAGTLARRFGASGQRALKLSGGAALLPLLAWHRSFGDPLLILALGLFSFGAPVALAYGVHARRTASDRGLAWAGLIVAIVIFGFFIGWMIVSTLNFGSAVGVWK